MRVMKDSGIPWIGEIPEDWVVRKLRNVGRFSASGIDKKIVEGEPLVHIINYVDVYKNPNKELRAQEYMIVSAPIEKCSEHQVNVGDMIFTPSSETIEDIGVSAVIMDELPNTAFSYHVLRFQPNNVVDLKYRKYFTNNNYCLNYFSSCATGTIRKTISRDVFKECLVVLPPLAEQQRIAEFLDRKCAEVDEMIALQEQIIEELKAYKQSVITEAVTKGLNPAAPMRDSGIEWIGSIPEHWEVEQFRRLFDIKKIIANELGYDVLSVTQGGLKVKDISTNEGQMAQDYSKYQLVGIDDYVMNHMDLLTGFVDCSKQIGVTSPDYRVFKAKHKSDISLPFFLRIFQTCYKLRIFYHLGQGVAGMGRWRLPAEQLKLFLLPIPPLAEQQTIADYLDEKCADIDSLIQTKQSKIDSLKEYKKSIIYEYVTGKREVE